MGQSDDVAHGALDHAELAALGLRAERLLDFSSNLNPFGPPASVRAALATLDPAPYPDRSCHTLRLALAERHHADPAAILPGNGANELIHLLARALLRPGDAALVIGPTYGEYAHASRLVEARVVELLALWPEPPATTGARYAGPPSVEAADPQQATRLIAAIEQARPRLTWLCAPNNPTGLTVAPETILALAEVCAIHGGYLILDRSYQDLQRPVEPLPQEVPPPGLIALYSLTKAYALAGLRLGYLLAAPALVARVARYQPAWSVSSAAQAAGLAALADQAFLATTVPQLWAASDQLSSGISALELPVWRARLPMLLVRTGDGAATRSALLKRGCVVRDCASFGLPAWVRVAPQRPEANARLLDAWRALG
ncbi:MAG: histidinol-phosphate transaminase [Chloroflexi bacterium OHK40]